jgi:N-acyl-D-amino-acid deacylase
MRILILFVFGSLVLSLSAGGQNQSDLDLIVANGRIIDGTGNPWYTGDIGIRNGKIIEIGRLSPTRAAKTINAANLIVAPGFIDVHTHVEGNIERLPTADNFIHMGVTSLVTGNCGSSVLDLAEWSTQLEKMGIAINVASLVGHNSVRHQAMNGDFDRPPTPDELQRMRDLVDRAMKEGAVGFSTGLEYVPGTFAKIDEIVELARVSARYGGIYATHMRNEDETVEKAIEESLTVGRQADCPVEISHFKISSKARWGASAITSRMVEDARASGQQVTVDQYVYTASSTGLGILFPSWIFDGGNEKTKQRLGDSVTRERVRREVIAKANRAGFTDLSFAVVSRYGPDASFNGKSISEITSLVRKKSGIDEEAQQAMDMLAAGGAQMVLHKMSDDDVNRILGRPYTMIASDGSIVDLKSASVPHPRSFGNNARVLGEYVRQRKVLTLEEAVRKMTSLPAQTFRLLDRGLLRPGMAADIVIFNPETVGDRATFREPKQHASGFEYVIVNGEVEIDKGTQTGTRSGRFIRASR